MLILSRKLSCTTGFVLLVLILAGLSSGQQTRAIAEPTLEWTAAVGATKQYKELKAYSFFNESGITNEYLLDDGSTVNITRSVGVTFTATITSLNDTFYDPPIAFVKISYQGHTLPESPRILLFPPTIPWHTSFLFKTTDNQTYWEEWCVENTDTQYADDSTIYWIENEQLYRHTFHRFGDPYINDTSDELWTYNWKTGWLVSHYFNYTNAAGTLLLESEFRDVSAITPPTSSDSSTPDKATSSDSGTPGLGVLSLLSIVLVAVGIVHRRKVRSSRNHNE
ncbi:MAG: hypothetical protein ACE5OZ_08570 [Candidatus Heimdallarchaeota archaeon]